MLVFLLLAMLAGVLLPVQAGVNAQLRATVGDPIGAALVSFVVGTAALALLVLVARLPVPVAAGWARSAWWHWVGGLLGAAYVAMVIVLAPRLGAAALIAAIVAGQMIASLVLDHYALVGFASHPVTAQRLLGTLLVIGGVALVRG
jgi:transporter family-2 protein